MWKVLQEEPAELEHSSDIQFLADFDKSDIALVNWSEVKQPTNKPEVDPTASPFYGSSGATSAAASSSEDEEHEEVFEEEKTPSKAKPLKKVPMPQLDNLPAFYRNTAKHKTVRKNGRKRKIVVSTEC